MHFFLFFLVFLFLKKKKKKRFIRVTERTTESMVRVSETKGFIFLFLGGGLACWLFFWLMCVEPKTLVRSGPLNPDAPRSVGANWWCSCVMETTWKTTSSLSLLISMIKLMTQVFVDDQLRIILFWMMLLSRSLGEWRNWSCWIISHSREMVSNAHKCCIAIVFVIPIPTRVSNYQLLVIFFLCTTTKLRNYNSRQL